MCSARAPERLYDENNNALLKIFRLSLAFSFTRDAK